jgi:hypothetical protein
MSSLSSLATRRSGLVVGGVANDQQSRLHASILSTMASSRVPLSAVSVSCLCLQVLQPKTARRGNAHSAYASLILPYYN